MDVFLTDGNSRSTLAATRSLGRRGLKVLAGDTTRRNLSARSRYCLGSVCYPSPARFPRHFTRWLLDFAPRISGAILIPMSDVTVTQVMVVRAELAPHVRMLLPSRNGFDTAMDKERLCRLAASLEIPVPHTYTVRNDSELERLARRVVYPVVVKPRFSRVLKGGRWHVVLVEYARNPTELIGKYRRINRLIAKPLIQERVQGPGQGYFALTRGGEILAEFAHRRLREKPPSGGVSVLRQAVPVEGRMREHARRLLRRLKFSGPVMVEFKRDDRSRTPLLMEVNCRFWGSLQLAVDAGVDFPYLLYQLLNGAGSRPTSPIRYGLRTRWLLGDLDHLLTIWMCSRRREFFPPEAPGRLTALASFVSEFGRGTRGEIFRWEDPGPGIGEWADYLGSLGRKARYVAGHR